MKLIPVDPNNKEHIDVLYELLKARPAKANVSHKRMPTAVEHEKFVRNHPYHDWCLIEIGGSPWDPIPATLIGSTFISKPAQPSVVGDELHVELFQGYSAYSFATHALKMMMAKHPRSRFIANVATKRYNLAQTSVAAFNRC